MACTVSCASMAVLTRDSIQRELTSGRLVIEPLDPSQIGPASIDLTLGDEIRVIVGDAAPIHVRDGTDYRAHTQAQRLEVPFVLAPGVMIHVTSAFVQPGVANRQVLEMSNVSGHPLVIHAGVRLCQLVLMRTEGRAVYRGRFAAQERP